MPSHRHRRDRHRAGGGAARTSPSAECSWWHRPRHDPRQPAGQPTSTTCWAASRPSPSPTRRRAARHPEVRARAQGAAHLRRPCRDPAARSGGVHMPSTRPSTRRFAASTSHLRSGCAATRADHQPDRDRGPPSSSSPRPSAWGTPASRARAPSRRLRRRAVHRQPAARPPRARDRNGSGSPRLTPPLSVFPTASRGATWSSRCASSSCRCASSTTSRTPTSSSLSRTTTGARFAAPARRVVGHPHRGAAQQHHLPDQECAIPVYGVALPDPRDALQEAQEGIDRARQLGGEVDLSPQNAYVRRLQHELVEQHEMTPAVRARSRTGTWSSSHGAS